MEKLREAQGAGGAAGPGPTGSDGDLEAVERLREGYRRIRSELQKVIVGQDQVLDEILIGIFARGHCLLVGVPGLAKTLMISTLSRSLSLSFSRIQFTPDLMPSDITGTEVIQEDRATGERRFRFLKGPIFANVILADEINRTPPKTQAALLEAMQERQVTAGGAKHPLDDPFFVLATQNPIEQEGTYPLPEAQLDRFMFNILVDYPSEEEEVQIMKRTTALGDANVQPVLSGPDILKLQEIVRRVPIADEVIRYVLRLTRATRVSKPEAPQFIKDLLAWGAGPRASQYLILGGKARALLHGRHYVAAEDIRAVAHPVLRHRILTNFSAEAEGVTSDKIIDRLLAEIEVNTSTVLKDARVPRVLGAS
jgi:MoxR-like ATPase